MLGSFLFSGDDVDKPAARAVRRREDPAGAGDAGGRPAPTCCCSTSPRTTSTRPAARRSSEALRTYEGAVVLVTHDEGAVEALDPERLILLPDGVEDLWNDDYADLVALA